MRFFGRRYPAPVYEDLEATDTPVGSRCAHCEEPIASGDDGWLIPGVESDGTLREWPFHANCHLRRVVGSVAHQQRRCACFVPGSGEEDDSALTRRQAADAAARFFERRPTAGVL